MNFDVPKNRKKICLKNTKLQVCNSNNTYVVVKEGSYQKSDENKEGINRVMSVLARAQLSPNGVDI